MVDQSLNVEYKNEHSVVHLQEKPDTLHLL